MGVVNRIYQKQINMKEALPVFLWKYRVLGQDFLSTERENIHVFSPGTENRDSGPDFINARIKIGDTLWAGNVEVHWNASDWKRHGHQDDPVYDSVILHVVMNADDKVKTLRGRQLVTLSLRDSDANNVIMKYESLRLSHHKIPCNNLMRNEKIAMPGPWLTRLAVERLEDRAETLIRQLMWEEGDWDKVFMTLLFRSYGQAVNAEAFIRLARKCLAVNEFKHLDTEDHEAVLLYLSGMLTNSDDDPWLKKLYVRAIICVDGIPPMPKSVWKFMRMRPHNFPSIRMAQLAAGLSGILAIPHACRLKMHGEEWRHALSVPASDYWDNHFRPGVNTGRSWTKKPGPGFVDTLIINAVVPYLAASARFENQNGLMLKALDMLENAKPEENVIIRQWIDVGIQPLNATESQGLVELFRAYCTQHKCLQCRIGYLLLHAG